MADDKKLKSKEKPKQAIALEYDPDDIAPRVVPPELYEVVAEILVFVDAMDKLKGKMNR